jgi:hypothetical protein
MRWLQVGLLAVLAGLLCLLTSVFWAVAPREIIHGSCFSPDGQLLARSADGGLVVFDLETAESWRLPDLGHVAFSPDGKLLACGSNQHISVWDWRAGKAVHTWPATNRWLSRVAFSPDGTKLAGMEDRSLRVWNLDTGDVVMTVPLPYEHDALAFSCDGRFVITAGAERKAEGERTHEIKLRTVPGGELHAVLTGPEYCIVRAIAVSPDGTRIAIGLSTNATRLWDVEARKEIWNEDVPANYDALAFSPDGAQLVAGSYEAITVLDVARPRDRRTLGVPASVNSAVGLADRFLVAAGTGVYSVGSGPDAMLVRSGLYVRRNLWRWGSGVAMLVWIGMWSLTCWRKWQKQPADARPTEWYAWAVVLGTACLSAGHLALLLTPTIWGDPLNLLSTLAVVWVLVAVVVVVTGTVFSRRDIGFICMVFCMLTCLGQAAFALWLWAAGGRVGLSREQPPGGTVDDWPACCRA